MKEQIPLKKHSLLAIFFLTSFGITGVQAKEAEWIPLFNGKDLDGWHNPYPHGTASVKNGVIELVADRKFFFAYNE